jgi:hypothetical protein
MDSNVSSLTEILRDFGLPTFLLLLFVTIVLVVLRRLYPLATSLVQTHIDFVRSMESETRRWAEDAKDWKEYLKERDTAQGHEMRKVREELAQLRNRPAG